MSDQFSDEKLLRLKELSALRDGGVLTEEEFQRAKARLLSADSSAIGQRAGGEGWSPRTRWLAIGGAGILVLILLFWLILPSQRRDDGVDAEIIDSGLILNGTEPEASGAELCAAGDTHRQLKDIIFDQAVEQYDGSPSALNSLRRAVGVRMQYPLMTNENRDIQRTDCSGRLTIDLPPMTREEFRGDSALEANLEFSLQPSVDGRAVVVDASGFEVVVQRLVAAAGLVGAAQAIKAAPELGKTYEPSFECEGPISDAERIICSDESLAELDRQLAARHARLQGQLSASQWASVEANRRDALQRRAQCADAACIRSVYTQQHGFLDGFVRDEAGAPNPL